VFVIPLYGTPSSNPIDDAKNLIGLLNPLSLALGPLIDKAAAAGDSVLQQRLEQLNGIIQLSLFTLNQIVQQRVEDIDQKDPATDHRSEHLRIKRPSAVQLDNRQEFTTSGQDFVGQSPTSSISVSPTTLPQ